MICEGVMCECVMCDEWVVYAETVENGYLDKNYFLGARRTEFNYK